LQRLVVAGHGYDNVLSLAPQNGGLLTDGMGTGGHNVSTSGQDFAVVQAAAGQYAQLDLRALWMHQGNNLRVTVDGGEETVLSGTVLPPVEGSNGGGRRFRSKPGGRIEVMLVTDQLTSLSYISLAVLAVCADISGCSEHGSCAGGNCTCSGGYSGKGRRACLYLSQKDSLLTFASVCCTATAC
jgi:hypothetical protein